ncbi:hypothetical protein Q5O14_07880 [Eubacteriaceae bacterium ES2]|nr:hypothetical protein Q5O14_07880 [Eubacteriaceae bacterium ES2]
MAKNETVAFMGGEDFMIKLDRLETDVNEIAKKAIYAGVEIVADRMRINLKGVLSEKATGELVEALGVTPITLLNGSWTGKIGFKGGDAGYDSKGVAFQLIARVLESGTSTQKKRPFMRKTINETRKQVEEVMIKTIDDEMKRIFG